MNLGTSLTIAAKELKVIRRKKSIISFIVAMPLLYSVLFSLLVLTVFGKTSTVTLARVLPGYLLSFTYFFVVMASILTTQIATYSIVGEKVEKSLEPLLAAPVTDSEILLGKSISAFLPPVIAMWAGSSIFMAAADYVTQNRLSYYYFPNWSSGVILLLLAPLAAIMSIEIGVMASSRVSDIRGANQIGGLGYVPMLLVFAAAVSGIIKLNVGTLLIISGIVLAADVALFFLSTSTFNREVILTKWK